MRFLQREPQAAPRLMPIQPRSPQARRLDRLRFAWFALGTACGAALAYYAVSHLHSDTDVSRTESAARIAFLSTHLAPLPAARSVVAVAPVATPQPLQAPLAQASVMPEAPLRAQRMTMPVRRGDTLMSMLMDKGIGQDEAYHVVESVKKVYNPRQMTVGQSVELHLDKPHSQDGHPSLSEMSIAVSPLTTVALSRSNGDAFFARTITSPIYKGTMRGGGVITSSLYQTGVDSGVPPQLINEVINALSYDVDFQRDIHQGDSLDIVYERMHTARNASAGYGSVLYASLVLGGKDYTLYRHVGPDGVASYYNAKGESVRKALLKTPINGAHITSSFGMRMHPLLGYTKMHKGIDFGAPTGTPIYAAGDGVVESAGIKGGYGNFVMLKHNATYATGYGHASRIAAGIRPGAHVKQGQVIAYVGSTGRSTGPHLHYEILVNGAQVNPSGVKFRTGQTLAGKELLQFHHEVKQVEVALATQPKSTQLAALASH